MLTNLAIDDRLLDEALVAGGHKTKKAAVNEALQEYVQRRRQLAVLGLFGKVEFDPKVHDKQQRRRA